MKSFTKRLTVTSLLLASLITTVASGAYAASSVSDRINYTSVYGSVGIGSNNAWASSSASEQIYMTVSLSHNYGLAGTTTTKTISGFDSGYKTDVMTSTTASEYASVSISANASHSWIVEGNQWIRSTSITR